MKKHILFAGLSAAALSFVMIQALTGCSGSMPIQEFNVENDAVSEYILNSNADLSGKEGNFTQGFFEMTRSYRPDQPRVMTIHFDNPLSDATVLLSENKDMSSPVFESIATSDSAQLRNMIPGKTYYYEVTSGKKVLSKGSFNTTGQVRMIAIDRGFNIRDLGGWTGLDGNQVRYGEIYRGASPGGTDRNGTESTLPESDLSELARIGIRAHLDLRAASDKGKYAGEYSLHSYSRSESTLLGVDYNNTMTDYGAYNEDASVIADVAWIIYELRRGRPVYFNCRQGADRTGTIAFVIEGLLGCYGEDNGRQMALDYELTGFSQANSIDNVAVPTSYRGSKEAATNSSKLFFKLLHLESDEVFLPTMQQKCYYYLNQYALKNSFSFTEEDKVQAIDKSDLDWFINFMLGVTDRDGNLTKGHSSLIESPSWAISTGFDLKSIGESKANVIHYAN